MRLYLTGDKQTRMLTCSIGHTPLFLIDIKKEKAKLKEIAEYSVEEVVEFLHASQGRRMFNLMTGKLRAQNEAHNEEWAEKAWYPTTDKVIEFAEYDDNELHEEFEVFYDKAKKRKQKKTLPPKKRKVEPEPEENIVDAVAVAKAKLRLLRARRARGR